MFKLREGNIYISPGNPPRLDIVFFMIAVEERRGGETDNRRVIVNSTNNPSAFRILRLREQYEDTK